MKKIIQNAKTLLNALTFANAGNFGEFEAMMNAMDKRPNANKANNQAKTLNIAQSHEKAMPAIQHLRSAA